MEDNHSKVDFMDYNSDFTIKYIQYLLNKMYIPQYKANNYCLINSNKNSLDMMLYIISKKECNKMDMYLHKHFLLKNILMHI